MFFLDTHLVIGIIGNLFELAWHCTDERALHEVIQERCDIYLGDTVKCLKKCCIVHNLDTACKLLYKELACTICKVVIEVLILWNEHRCHIALL